MKPAADVAIVGGGLIGLATARELLERWPQRSLLLLEKEPALASHQSTHNSGIIHSGLYYRPGSVKAKTCVEGARLLVEFCRARGIPYRLCGKLVVATEEAEVPALEQLYRQGLENGVSGLSLIGPERMREIEPHARGLKALHVASAGVVDYAVVAKALAGEIERRGGRIHTSVQVLRFIHREGAWVLETTQGVIRAKMLVTCGGLHADRLARAGGAANDVQIVPFRGEYYEVIPERAFLVKSMIYPVPDPALPFLGVHVTRAVDGTVHAGPNAVLALKREGYRKAEIDVRDVFEMIRFPGFYRMARKYWRVGLSELYRSASKVAFVRSVQRLVPEIRARDCRPSGAGVRAQALERDGRLLDDFDIVRAAQAVHVRNVPSPAATSCLAIGRSIADLLPA